MQIGRIVALPQGRGAYGQVRDEHGMVYSVHASELPEDAEPGDDMPYFVDIWNNRSGPATTLKLKT